MSKDTQKKFIIVKKSDLQISHIKFQAWALKLVHDQSIPEKKKKEQRGHITKTVILERSLKNKLIMWKTKPRILRFWFRDEEYEEYDMLTLSSWMWTLWWCSSNCFSSACSGYKLEPIVIFPLAFLVIRMFSSWQADVNAKYVAEL